MLLHRLLAALILIPVVILTILYSSNAWFLLLSLILVLLLVREWSNLYNFNLKKNMVFLLLVTVPGLFFLYKYHNVQQVFGFASIVFNIIFVLSALIQIYIFKKVYSFNQDVDLGFYFYIKNSYIIQALLGLLFITPFWLGLCYLKFYFPPELLILLFLIVWIIDSGAYFIGKVFGRTKLIPEVSPGKTWEGLFGGFLFLIVLNIIVFVYMLAINFNFQLKNLNWQYCDIINTIMFNIIIFIYAVFGDLTESMMKRIKKVKDSGSLIPGHGGMLDRLDSIIAVIPIYCLIIQYYK